jgi:2-polyprenyl-6-methoxyphenol hydroxylase-like FAD-dependent oxidoreductase
MFQPTNSNSKNSHALVIGGSIAGLLAAQVLSKYFERVTIIERDRFPDQPTQRPGVPQSHHVHVLLQRGQQILEELFPGIEAELAAAGAPRMDAAADSIWLGLGGWAPRFDSGVTTCNSSRNLLEWTIRRRLTANNRVVFVQAGQVTNLLSNPNQTSVTGVRVRLRQSETETDFPADLVVDASGRNSRAPQWLEAMGYAPPQETAINSFLGYTSRWYQPPADVDPPKSPLIKGTNENPKSSSAAARSAIQNPKSNDWKALLISAKPPYTRGGVVTLVEENRWVVTLVGIGRDYAPTDEAGFLEFARSLRSPMIYEAIKDAQPISPILAYQRTENRLRHYEKLSRLPDGFVLVGDAVCAFNPVYGQGMTAAALAAFTLDRCLSQQLSNQSHSNLVGFPRRFQKQLSHAIAVPWLMATGEDFRWPTTEGGQPDLIARLMQKYLDRVLLLTAENPEMHKLFLEVMHLLKPPSAFFQPNILLQVLKQAINGHRKDEQSTQQQNIAQPLSSVVEPLLKNPN